MFDVWSVILFVWICLHRRWNHDIQPLPFFLLPPNEIASAYCNTRRICFPSLWWASIWGLSRERAYMLKERATGRLGQEWKPNRLPEVKIELQWRSSASSRCVPGDLAISKDAHTSRPKRTIVHLRRIATKVLEIPTRLRVWLQQKTTRRKEATNKFSLLPIDLVGMYRLKITLFSAEITSTANAQPHRVAKPPHKFFNAIKRVEDNKQQQQQRISPRSTAKYILYRYNWSHSATWMDDFSHYYRSYLEHGGGKRQIMEKSSGSGGGNRDGAGGGGGGNRPSLFPDKNRRKRAPAAAAVRARKARRRERDGSESLLSSSSSGSDDDVVRSGQRHHPSPKKRMRTSAGSTGGAGGGQEKVTHEQRWVEMFNRLGKRVIICFGLTVRGGIETSQQLCVSFFVLFRHFTF